MIKPIKDFKTQESLATLALSGYGTVLIRVLKEEQDAIKDLWAQGDGSKEEEQRGRIKTLRDVIALLEQSEVAAERLKQRQ